MKITAWISRIFFPERCTHCGRLIPVYDRFCHKCSLNECSVPEGFCFHCNSRSCRCTENTRVLSRITAPFIYTDAAKELITSLKFRKQKSCALPLSEALAKRVVEGFCDTDFDFVTFVPMTDKAKRKRGYNQSELIARGVAERLFIPCVEALIKTKDTPSQHHLSAEERRKIPSDAITHKDGAQIKGKTVLICDDIKTTGSTLLACQRALVKGGAAAVYCAVAAIPVYGNPYHGIDKEIKKL